MCLFKQIKQTYYNTTTSLP